MLFFTCHRSYIVLCQSTKIRTHDLFIKSHFWTLIGFMTTSVLLTSFGPNAFAFIFTAIVFVNKNFLRILMTSYSLTDLR